MSDTNTIGLDRPEAEITCDYEVSDEVLEGAAGTGSKQAGKYTIVCTYFYVCPI